jgi:hypothetical protein
MDKDKIIKYDETDIDEYNEQIKNAPDLSAADKKWHKGWKVADNKATVAKAEQEE